jgi:hypothetical protein
MINLVGIPAAWLTLTLFLCGSALAEESGRVVRLAKEVFACIAFRHQSEIDQLFEADKRGLVVTLRDLKLVEEFAGADGRSCQFGNYLRVIEGYLRMDESRSLDRLRVRFLPWR